MISQPPKAKAIGTLFKWLSDLSVPLFFLYFFNSSFPNTFKMCSHVSEAARLGI